MEEKWERWLREALRAEETAEEALDQSILRQAQMRKFKESGRSLRGWRSLRGAAAAACICLTVGATTLTGFAAYRLLSALSVAEQAGDSRLAEAFAEPDAVLLNESQTYGEYRVTLVGIVSGEHLSQSEYFDGESGEILADRTYAVTAIERADGEPMPGTWEDAYGELSFFASPLVQGLDPAWYNAASLNGGYREMWRDGVLYRLVECDDVEIFADRTLYFCVNEGSFYDRAAYAYDPKSGRISREEGYDGLNALFVLPVPEEKADPEKAEAYLASHPDLALLAAKAGSPSAQVDPSALQISGDGRQGAEIAQYALQFVGTPFAYGESSLTEGTDSSGFAKSVYAYFQIELPHTSTGQRTFGTEVDGMENALPGDLIFYEKPSHVAVYLGDGLIVHALPEEGVCVSEADFSEICEIRRIWK